MMGCGTLKSQVGTCSALAGCVSRLGAASGMRPASHLLSSFWRDGPVFRQLLVSGHKWLPCIPVPELDCQTGGGFQPLHAASNGRAGPSPGILSCCVFLGSCRQRNVLAVPGRFWETELPWCGQIVCQLRPELLEKMALCRCVLLPPRVGARFGVCFFSSCDSRCLESQLGDDGEPLLMLG